MRKTLTFPASLKAKVVARRQFYNLLFIILLSTLVITNSWLAMKASFVQEASAYSFQATQSKSYNLPDVDNFVNIPYFINSNDLTSTLVLNNDLPDVAKAEVTLFNRQGEPLKLPGFTLQPFNAERFNLAGLTSNAPGDFSSGNIQIYYHAPMMSITSQVTVASESKRISFESPASSAMDYHSSQLSAILWLPDNETQAKAALTNTTASPIIVTAQAGLQKRAINLGPRETQVLELRDFISTGQGKSLATLLTLGSTGAPGALIATGFAYNEANGFSTNLPFLDRSTIISVAETWRVHEE